MLVNEVNEKRGSSITIESEVNNKTCNANPIAVPTSNIILQAPAIGLSYN